jgi:peptide deformylase
MYWINHPEETDDCRAVDETQRRWYIKIEHYFKRRGVDMVRPIIKDIFFLQQKSVPAGKADLPIAADLQDTLKAHRNECVGMAANMIGFQKNIIIVSLGLMDLVMLNPAITKKTGPYDAEEGCLSLTGTRKTRRYQNITVKYQDIKLQWHTQNFSGWPAQIIQHECDHLQGILI